MNTISREYHFAAAHRLEGHPKCGRLHGHNYKVTVSVCTYPDNKTGMIIDYGSLDDLVKPIINLFDHRYIISADNLARKDPYAKVAIGQDHAYEANVPFSTAECLSERIASVLYLILRHHMGGDIDLSVDVQESEKSHASYSIG
jgi:6-pyruvoyltetrahydropterin/6-carboxytetrahydropterin synthase